MPGFDGTGPIGMGPMTGGGRGICASSRPGMRPQSLGRGVYGRGSGRGRRNWFYATGLPGWQRAAAEFSAFGGFDATFGKRTPGSTWTAKEEKEILNEQVRFLNGQLAELQARIATLDKDTT